MQPTISQLHHFFDSNLAEDLGIGGDVTSNAVIRETKSIDFTIASRQKAVICGLAISDYFFANHGSIKHKNHYKDGDLVAPSSVIISGTGDARAVLKLERLVLNYLQHLSGVATLTHSYVKAVAGTKAKICDTRKTIPGLRILQKYAVHCGGGNNHRYSLDNGVLIKDNHIEIVGSISLAVENARRYAPHILNIEVECDTIEQVKEALSAKVDIIMLDNMNLDKIKLCVALIGGRAKIDVSGGVNISSVADIARAGADYISIGRLTHSAPAVDIGLDI